MRIVLAILAIVAHSSIAQALSIDWITLGNAGNAADSADGDSSTPGVQNFGNVPYSYRIGKYEVTVDQYVEFLNAKDASGANTLALYNSGMSDATYGGINFAAGNPSGSKYSAIAGRGDHPVNYVSWYNAIRFVNWLNNGQGSGDTETGAYTLGPLGLLGLPITPPLTHNVGSKVWLPTENEWYKAAYYDPRSTAQGGPPGDSHYWLYGTSSNSTPVASGPTALANHANYGDFGAGPLNLTDVGAYTGTTSAYGAFDMAGNVYEWNEALIDGVFRGARGGSFDSLDSAIDLQSSLRGHGSPDLGDLARFTGIRVASVPEPSSVALAATALVGLIALCRRKRA